MGHSHQKGINSCHVLSVVCLYQLWSEKVFFSSFWWGFCKWIPSAVTHFRVWLNFPPCFISLPFKVSLSFPPWPRGDPAFIRLNSFVFHILPPPAGSVTLAFVIVSCCSELTLSEWASPRSFGQCVEALHSHPRSRIVSLSHRWWCWLTHTSLPPFQLKSTRRWERMKTKWAGEMFRGSDREIRDKAQKRKPLCVSTGHRHNNPSLPS